MPRAVAGQDFLGSVGALFQEVLHEGYPGQDGFALVRRQLVDLLLMMSETTAAKARASTPVKLPDGREPETHIQLPPATLRVDASLALRLNSARDPAAFTALLREAIAQQKLPAFSRKRKNECGAGSTPRKRIVLKRPGPLPQTPGSTEKKPETPVSRTAALIDLLDVGHRLPSPPTTTAAVKMNIKKNDKAIMSPSAFLKKVTRTAAPRTEHEIVGVAEEACDAAPDAGERMEDERDGDEASDSDYEMEDATDDGMSAEFSMEGFIKFAEAVDNSRPNTAAEEAESAETLKQIIDDVCNTSSEQWEAYRPKLLESLLPYAEMEYAKLNSLGPTVARDALTRLEAATARLGDDMSVIEADDWSKYKQKLHKLCGARVFATYNFAQRLRKVMDVMYMDEETKTMETGDWDRLETVVKIITTLCEAMGPAEEEAAEVSQRWFRSKVQDIRFLKRIMTSINRKTQVLQVQDDD